MLKIFIYSDILLNKFYLANMFQTKVHWIKTNIEYYILSSIKTNIEYKLHLIEVFLRLLGTSAPIKIFFLNEKLCSQKNINKRWHSFYIFLTMKWNFRDVKLFSKLKISLSKKYILENTIDLY